MKALGRILIILCAFALVMGLTYVVVNAGSSSVGTAAPAFERDRGFPPDGARPEFHGERGGGWMFGMVKNVGIIAVVVALVTIPQNVRRRIRYISVSSG
jgi:hypothetical protein